MMSHKWDVNCSQISVERGKARLDRFPTVKVARDQGNLPILQLTWKNKQIWLVSRMPVHIYVAQNVKHT